MRILVIFGIISFFSLITVSDAYAYLDPGTGMIIVQAVLGALIGLGVTLKIFWHRIKEKLTKKPF